jgi:hypothetical protein
MIGRSAVSDRPTDAKSRQRRQQAGDDHVLPSADSERSRSVRACTWTMNTTWHSLP